MLARVLRKIRIGWGAWSFLPVSVFGASAIADWQASALQLTGVAASTQRQAMSELRARPDLIPELRRALRAPSEPSRRSQYLALDVIAALRLRSLLPELMTLSEREPSGYFYGAINALLTPANRAECVRVFQRRVTAPRTSPAARMVLLDMLARLGSALPFDELASLFQDSHEEVRSAALSYARAFLIRRRNLEYLPLVRLPLSRGTVALRAQAVFLVRELAPDLPGGESAWLQNCPTDPSEEIRALCRKGLAR